MSNDVRSISSQRKYTLFIVYHTMSGFLDSFDGLLARYFEQTSYVGQFLDSILDQYAHVLIYAAIGYLYSSYIIFFFLEIALELWSHSFSYYMLTLPKYDSSRFNQSTFLSRTCSFPLWDHDYLRLFRWYGSDIFHTLLVMRYILMHEHDQKFVVRLKRYVSMNKLQSHMRLLIIFMGISSFLRMILSSCSMIDKLQRLARL
jgi:phosphatidylglycerophosphate synthase